jgi:hypothetical protein
VGGKASAGVCASRHACRCRRRQRRRARRG